MREKSGLTASARVFFSRTVQRRRHSNRRIPEGHGRPADLLSGARDAGLCTHDGENNWVMVEDFVPSEIEARDGVDDGWCPQHRMMA
ncbi:MAG: hypothetical protein ABIR54_08565 [Burkholderiaceae bacterium]